MPVRIEKFVLGPLETNTYLVRCRGECWVIDPGMGPRPLLRALAAGGDSPSRILLTHGHGDHIAGVGELKRAFPSARLCCPAGDADMLPDAEANLSAGFGVRIVSPAADELLQPGDELTCGDSRWRVLDTSGHTPGGVSYHCEQEAVVIVGDALFAGSIGRTDIPGGSLARLVKNIRLSLMTLDDRTAVLSGHGPAGTIGEERRTNPFLKDFHVTRNDKCP